MEFIDLTNKSRLKIDTDPVPLNPRLDECVTGCYTPPSWWGHRVDGPEPKFDFPGNLVVADDKLFDESSWIPERKVQRWAWANYGILVERHGATYWYCDEQMFRTMIGDDFSREMQAAVIQADRLTYKRYLDGDARMLTLQRKATFKRVGKGFPDLIETWEDVQSHGDLYFDEDDTPAQAALDYFHLSKKEEAVISAMIDSAKA